MKEYLVISTTIDLLQAASEDIVYISADGNYCSIFFAHGENHVVTVQLGQMEILISKQLKKTAINFVRIGKSMIVNTLYVRYINLPKQQLVLSVSPSVGYTLSVSKDALRRLKDHIEKNTRK